MYHMILQFTLNQGLHLYDDFCTTQSNIQVNTLITSAIIQSVELIYCCDVYVVIVSDIVYKAIQRKKAYIVQL